MEKPVRIVIDVIINPEVTCASGFNIVRIGTEEKFSESLVVDLKKEMSWIEIITEVSKPAYEFMKTIPDIGC